jgi:hypothetical protein
MKTASAVTTLLGTPAAVNSQTYEYDVPYQYYPGTHTVYWLEYPGNIEAKIPFGGTLIATGKEYYIDYFYYNISTNKTTIYYYGDYYISQPFTTSDSISSVTSTSYQKFGDIHAGVDNDRACAMSASAVMAVETAVDVDVKITLRRLTDTTNTTNSTCRELTGIVMGIR